MNNQGESLEYTITGFEFVCSSALDNDRDQSGSLDLLATPAYMHSKHQFEGPCVLQPSSGYSRLSTASWQGTSSVEGGWKCFSSLTSQPHPSRSCLVAGGGGDHRIMTGWW